MNKRLDVKLAEELNYEVLKLLDVQSLERSEQLVDGPLSLGAENLRVIDSVSRGLIGFEVLEIAFKLSSIIDHRRS